MLKACEEGYMDATILAEYLVRKGIPFRQSHHVVGNLVRMAEERGVELRDLSVGELKSAHAFLNEEVKRMLGGSNVVHLYASAGSPNPKFVRTEVESWKVRLRDEGAMPGKRRKKDN